MKALNYVICSTIIFIGIVLFLSGEIVPTIAGLIWLALNIKFSCLNIHGNQPIFRVGINN